ncbi:MAG: hypothetical protein ACP5XB_05470 [Isosphaeraceae bacterium]
MKTAAWVVLAAIGLGLMVLTYEKQIRGNPQAPWASGLLFIGEGEPAKPVEAGTVVWSRLRLLPASDRSAALLKAAERTKSLREAKLGFRLRPKLIDLPVDEMVHCADWLREGRIPEPGKHEVLAGAQTPPGDHLSVAGETFRVVGVLQPSMALLADCYVAPADPSLDVCFSKRDDDVHQARLLHLSAGFLRDRKQLNKLIEAFPPPRFAILMPWVRPERDAFLAYLAAQALFLLGGTGVLISLYRWLAGWVRLPLLAAPLEEMVRRPRLLWGGHLVYFGLFVVGALIIYPFPDVHTVIMTAVQGEIASKDGGVLAVAGKAYGTGNMFYAAAVTFVINFFLGSLAMISIPSMIIPGCGALLAVCRSMLWGLLLGPTENTLSWLMLPHTGTLLLEGGGYILAAFFAILVPVYLFRPGQPDAKPLLVDELASSPEVDCPPHQTFGRRFRSALTLNLKGNVLVAMVLAVAACYESVEVILMAGF